MNIILWILQVALGLHTVTGAIWKFSNSEQTVGSLKAIPHTVWLSLSIVEILCSLVLILAIFSKSLRKLVPLSAFIITLEMLAFSVLHLFSGEPGHSEMVYWLVVAVISGIVGTARIMR